MRVIILFVLLSISTMLWAKEAKEYVGLVYPPMPLGLVAKGGGLATLRNASANRLWYAHIEHDGTRMIWLERESGRITEGGIDRPLWRVEDTWVEPTLHARESIFLGYDIKCSFKGELDSSIIAIGKWSSGKNGVGGYAHHIRLAWRIHPVLAKFESISPTETSCELNEDRD